MVLSGRDEVGAEGAACFGAVALTDDKAAPASSESVRPERVREELSSEVVEGVHRPGPEFELEYVCACGQMGGMAGVTSDRGGTGRQCSRAYCVGLGLRRSSFPGVLPDEAAGKADECLLGTCESCQDMLVGEAIEAV